MSKQAPRLPFAAKMIEKESTALLNTALCEKLGIDHPVIQGPLGGPWEVGVDLVAAVSKAGGLGSVATSLRSADEVRAAIRRVRELADDRPFAVNVTRRPFDEQVFETVLAERPAVDVVIAQGGEGGGFSGSIGTLTLVPQVVDAVAPVPVVAAGGITDGRGLAAAIVLGADGVNIGTAFLATLESRIPESWKRSIVAAESEDAVKVDFAEYIAPPVSEGGWTTVPRSLRTPFVDEWIARRDEVPQHAEELQREFVAAIRSGNPHEYLPLTGQSAGAIKDVLPAAEIVRRVVAEAVEVLHATSGL